VAELDETVFCGWMTLEEERDHGTALLAELGRGRRGWHELDRDEQRLASGVALIDVVLERCRKARFEDPAAMVDWARTGCELAELALDPNGNPVALEVRALAWAELGNAYRVADDLDRAAEALGQARKLALVGQPSSPLLVRLLELLASLLTDQRQFAEAAEILERLEILYRERGDCRELARVLLQLAHVRNQAHEPEHAVLVFLRALKLLRPGDPLLLAAVHGLAFNLVEADLPEVAQVVIEGCRRLYRKGGRLNGIRLLWLEGRVAFALDQLRRAEVKLNLARLAFLRIGKPGDAALVSLDLALLLARQERRKELSWLVEQMLATFRRLGIAREAIASLLLLKSSCEDLTVDRLCGQIEALARLLPELEPRSKSGRKHRIQSV
jgi:tetratricopeptide (TPR) repeat protein